MFTPVDLIVRPVILERVQQTVIMAKLIQSHPFKINLCTYGKCVAVTPRMKRTKSTCDSWYWKFFLLITKKNLNTIIFSYKFLMTEGQHHSYIKNIRKFWLWRSCLTVSIIKIFTKSESFLDKCYVGYMKWLPLDAIRSVHYNIRDRPFKYAALFSHKITCNTFLHVNYWIVQANIFRMDTFWSDTLSFIQKKHCRSDVPCSMRQTCDVEPSSSTQSGPEIHFDPQMQAWRFHRGCSVFAVSVRFISSRQSCQSIPSGTVGIPSLWTKTLAPCSSWPVGLGDSWTVSLSCGSGSEWDRQ